MKILIADDNPKMRQMIKNVLTANIKNIDTIYECENGREAIDLYSKHHPDWTLMDIKMDPVDGLLAARVIKAADREAKIVLVTSYDEDSYRQEAKKISIFAYVLKENLQELIPIYKKLFNQHMRRE